MKKSWHLHCFWQVAGRKDGRSSWDGESSRQSGFNEVELETLDSILEHSTLTSLRTGGGEKGNQGLWEVQVSAAGTVLLRRDSGSHDSCQVGESRMGSFGQKKDHI